MNNDFVTCDLALTAYIKMRSQIDPECKMKFKRYDKKNGKKVEFIFEDPEHQSDYMQVEFLNSESKKYDSEIRDLKKILY